MSVSAVVQIKTISAASQLPENGKYLCAPPTVTALLKGGLGEYTLFTRQRLGPIICVYTPSLKSLHTKVL